MRTMPTIISGDGDFEFTMRSGIEIPTIDAALWWAKLGAICNHCTGRDLTRQEAKRADKMANHNWTLRAVADALFDECRVDDFFKP